jgi:hypothetical protein
LATLLCEAMGRPELRAEYHEERKVNPARNRLDATERARERLGCVTMTNLRDGLNTLVAWRRAVVRSEAGYWHDANDDHNLSDPLAGT